MSDSLSSEEVSKSMWDSLPPEIITDIFLRLPVKSIITCTCVSKTWKYLIQNPTFISNHLHYSNNNSHPLLFFCLPEENEKEQYVLHFDNNQDFNEYTRFDCDPFRVVGTCNGLIFLADDSYGHCYIIYNPCVRKFVKLPKPNINFSSHGCYDASGFGFDSKTNDYKVVRFVTLEQKVQKGKSRVEVYSLSTGKWRMVSALPPIAVARDSDSKAFVNGALHWVALRKTRNELLFFVMVFDLGEEVFHEIALPKSSDYWSGISISAYGNSLALFQRGYSIPCLNIWVMKDYADASSWTKIITLPDEGFIEVIPSIPRPIGFRKSGEVILDMHGGYLVSRDLETQEIKDLRICEYGCYLVDSYVESLVLLDKPNQGRKRQKRKRNNDRFFSRCKTQNRSWSKRSKHRFFLRCKTQNCSWSKHSKHRKGSNLGGRNS
nr:F-box protein CPR1-like isoform X2 [Quercus suber]